VTHYTSEISLNFVQKNAVILSERSESKDLRLGALANGWDSANLKEQNHAVRDVVV